MRLSTGNKQRHGQRGYVLVTAAMFALAFVGALGLVVDLGRLYVLKSEAQARADAAALGGAVRLDGTPRGVANAAEIVRSEVEFSVAPDGPWRNQRDASPEAQFVRVRVRLQTPVFFSRLLTGDSAGSVGATAVAGQVEKGEVKAGGFRCDVSELAERVRQDTDRDSKTYEEYAAQGRGNGRRIVPCDAGASVGGFFVTDESGARESIGAYVEGGRSRGAGSRPGYFLVRLVG